MEIDLGDIKTIEFTPAEEIKEIGEYEDALAGIPMVHYARIPLSGMERMKNGARKIMEVAMAVGSEVGSAGNSMGEIVRKANENKESWGDDIPTMDLSEKKKKR